MTDPIQSKIFSLKDFLVRSNEWSKAGKTTVFTNGVFDLVHRGHIDYLYKASQLGDRLIIGLNSDASVKRLEKGDDRPLISQSDRAYLLASFFFIDAVIIFEEDTPLNLIEAILPDVLVKGGDYDPKAQKEDKKYIVGSDTVKNAGGKVDVIAFLPGYSTTALVNKIRK